MGLCCRVSCCLAFVHQPSVKVMSVILGGGVVSGGKSLANLRMTSATTHTLPPRFGSTSTRSPASGSMPIVVKMPECLFMK